jgi:Protein of unknown function (DUF3499)
VRWAGSSTGGREPFDGRRCARPGCGASADATMTYDYGRRTAWVDDLTEIESPAGYDLCGAHATSFSVPQGWTRSERRTLAGRRGADDDRLATSGA